MKKLLKINEKLMRFSLPLHLVVEGNWPKENLK